MVNKELEHKWSRYKSERCMSPAEKRDEFFLNFTFRLIRNFSSNLNDVREKVKKHKMTRGDPFSFMSTNPINAFIVTCNGSDAEASDIFGKNLRREAFFDPTNRDKLKKEVKEFLVVGFKETLQKIMKPENILDDSKQKEILSILKNGTKDGCRYTVEEMVIFLDKHFLITDEKMPQKPTSNTNGHVRLDDKSKEESLHGRSYADAYDSLHRAKEIYTKAKEAGRVVKIQNKICIIETSEAKSIPIEVIVHRLLAKERKKEIPLKKIERYLKNYKLSGDQVVDRNKNK